MIVEHKQEYKPPKPKRHGCRNAVRNTFLIVVGMLLGIILFVIAIAGTLYAALTVVSVGDLQNTFGVSIINKENQEMINMSLIDVVQSLIGMVSNYQTLSINDITSKFTLPIPDNIEGIDITPLFGYSILEIPNHLNDVVSNITVDNITRLAKIDLASYGVPLLLDLKTQPINSAIDYLLRKINGDILSLRFVETELGIHAANDNFLLNKLKDVTFATLGNVVDQLTINDIMKIDCDSYICISDADKYTVANEYEEISNLSTQGKANHVVETSIFGATATDLDKKEMRYVKARNDDGTLKKDAEENQVYEIDNSSYSIPADALEFEGYKRAAVSDPFTKDTELAKTKDTYFRHITYKPFTDGDPIKFVNSYACAFYDNAGTFLPVPTNLVEVVNPASIDIGRSSTGVLPTNDTEFIPDFFSDPTQKYFKKIIVEGETTYSELIQYAIPTDANADSVLVPYEDGQTYQKTGYYLLKKGTSEKTLQTIAHTKIKNLENLTGKIKNLKLKDVIPIDETSPRVLKSLADTSINGFSDKINSLTLNQMIDIYETDTPEHIKSPTILIALQNTTLNSVGDQINLLKLNQIIDIYDTDTPEHPISPKILIALQNETLNTMSAKIDDLTLKDVIDIPDDASALLKKLKDKKINNLGNEIDELLKTITIGELVDINDFNQFVIDDTTPTNIIFETQNPYVSDINGKYYLDTNGLYHPITEGTPSTTDRYKRQVQYVKDITGAYIYISETRPANPDDEISYVTYTFNYSYPALLISKNITFTQKGLVPYDPINDKMPKFPDIDISLEGDAFTNAITGKLPTDMDFYALDLENEVLKQAMNGTYSNETEHANNIVSFINANDFSKAFVKITIENYKKYKSFSYPKFINIKHTGIFLDSVANSGYFGFIKKPSTYTATENELFKKVYASPHLIKIADTDSKTNTYVLTNHQLVLDTDGTMSEDHFNLIYGYLGTTLNLDTTIHIAENQNITNVSNISNVSYIIKNEKPVKQSEKILLALSEKSIYSMNDAFTTLTLGTLIEEKPDSFFEGEIMASTISNLPTAIANKISTSTIGEIMTWANINVAPEIASALSDLKLNDFFSSLEIQTINGKPLIVFDVDSISSSTPPAP